MSWFNWLRGGRPALTDNDDNPSTAEIPEAVAMAGPPEVPSVVFAAAEQAPAGDPEVTAAEVFESFRTNQVAAEDRFLERCFLVVGEVRSVQRDLYGHAQVYLAVGDHREQPVLFPDGARERLVKLEPGSVLRVRVRVKESSYRGDVKLEAVETA
jgi:hypothetical protein